MVTAQPTSLGQARFRLSVVPPRVAYLIAAGSKEGFRRAVGEATTRWGGATEPIIPVRRNGFVTPFWKQVVEILRPVSLVSVDADLTAASRFASRVSLDIVSLDRIDREGRGKHCPHPAHLEWSGGQWSNSPAVVSSEAAELWEVAAAGSLGSEALADYNTGAFRLRSARTEDEIGRAQLWRTTALDGTTEQLPVSSGSNGPWPGQAVLWVMKPHSLKDAVAYWNLRALRPLQLHDRPMALLPDRGLESWHEFDRQVREQLRRPVSVTVDATIFSLSVPESRLVEIGRALGLKQADVPYEAKLTFPEPDLREEPFSFQVGKLARYEYVFGRTYGRESDSMVQLFDTETAVDIVSPVRARVSGHTLVRLASSAFDSFPKDPQVAQMIHPHAQWADGRLELATNLMDRYRWQLAIPRLEAVAWQTLNGRVAEPVLSDKGRLAEALERTLGSATLLEPGVVDVIRFLTTPRSRHLAQMVERLSSAGFDERDLGLLRSVAEGRGERRYRSASDIKSDLGASGVRAAERLALTGFAERGLCISCDTCAVTSFIPLAEGGGRATCPACATESEFRTGLGPTVYYRLNGVVDRASDNGVIGHLQARAALSNHYTTSTFIAGVEFKLNGAKSELDLYGVADGQIVTGEIKVSASEFTDRQLERDVRLSASVASHVHVVGSCETIPLEVRVAATQLASLTGLRQLAFVSGSDVELVRLGAEGDD